MKKIIMCSMLVLSGSAFAVGFSTVDSEESRLKDTKGDPVYSWTEVQKVKVEKLVFKNPKNKEQNERIEKMFNKDTTFTFCSREGEYLSDSLADLESDCEIKKKGYVQKLVGK